MYLLITLLLYKDLQGNHIPPPYYSGARWLPVALPARLMDCRCSGPVSCREVRRSNSGTSSNPEQRVKGQIVSRLTCYVRVVEGSYRWGMILG